MVKDEIMNVASMFYKVPAGILKFAIGATMAVQYSFMKTIAKKK